jgi:hypothetical protein
VVLVFAQQLLGSVFFTLEVVAAQLSIGLAEAVLLVVGYNLRAAQAEVVLVAFIQQHPAQTAQPTRAVVEGVALISLCHLALVVLASSLFVIHNSTHPQHW